MAVIPIWVVHEGKWKEGERLAKDLEWVEWYPGVLGAESSAREGRLDTLQF